MTLPDRTIEPTVIYTRSQVEWVKTYDDYPATAWQLNYYFRGPGTGMTLAWGTEVTADSDDFVIIIPAAKTDDMTVAGIYHWQAWLTEAADSANKIMIGAGRTRVELGFDPASTATVETRSTAKRIVDAIDAAVLANPGPVIEYEISTPTGSRKVKRNRKDALEERTYYAGIVAQELARERARSGKSLNQTVGVRFSDV